MVAREPDPVHLLSGGEKLHYRLTTGTGDSLIVYFDYSRLVEKVDLHEEFVPRFNFRTNDHVLVISNAFGHWGTSCLFSSDGRLIIHEVAGFLRDTVERLRARRVYLIGGSQGGTAALVYGALIEKTEAIYSAVPVPVSTKSMLRHLADRIEPSAIWCCDQIMRLSFECRNVNLFSTIGDPIYTWHKSLPRMGRENVSFELCQDTNVGHGDCLRYFIKTIYSNITSRERTLLRSDATEDTSPESSA